MDPGDYVIDSDDDAPDLAVVVHRPGVSIAEIPVNRGDAARSVAADNPTYDPTEPAVVVAFVESGLTQAWPDWLDHRAEGLHAGAQTHHITLYTFPEPRLSTVSRERAAGFLAEPALAMAALETRLVAAGWQVARTEQGTLVAETMGEQYRIYPTGELEEDGQIRDPLANIVAQYRDKFSSERPAPINSAGAMAIRHAIAATCPVDRFWSRGRRSTVCRSTLNPSPRQMLSNGT